MTKDFDSQLEGSDLMNGIGKLHGVKNRPSVSPAGLEVVAIEYAVQKKMYFAVLKAVARDGSLRHYVVERLKKSGEFAKKTPEQLWSSSFECEGQAKDAIWLWDSGWTERLA